MTAMGIAAPCIGIAARSYAEILRRIASINNGGRVATRNRRREEIRRRVHAWEENGYEGSEKMRVL